VTHAPAAAPRIVSLLPSATEILCGLGLRASLVGVSHECDHPADVVGLPVVTRAKIDVTRTSREIDDDIRALVRNGLGVYEIDTERLEQLAPDLIVTQDQCDVCAVSYEDVVAAVKQLTGTNAEIVSLRPNRLADVWDDVRRVGAAAGVPQRAHDLANDLGERLVALGRRTRGLPRVRIACLEWLDPLMAAGNWVPELVDLAGGTSDLATAGRHSPWLDFASIAAFAPEVVCAMPCGFDLERTERELRGLLRDPRWQELAAVRAGRCFAVDGNAFFNRPGPRLIESAEILAGLLHPGECAALVPADAVARVAPPAASPG
jgi:iron complex transport system substrate-binding protein